MAKICRIVFSTNRLEFLIPTLQSHEEFVDFGDNEVDNILIDDYPLNRYDNAIIDIAKKYNFNEVVLHNENKGLTKTWTECWEYISKKDYDYVWHHEDDVVFLQPVDINCLIHFLEKHSNFCQVNLKRNSWYEEEFNVPLIDKNDKYFCGYRYNSYNDFFWTMASLYPTWITKEPIVQEEKCNLGEFPVMNYLNKKYNMEMAVLKNYDGTHMVNHIGEYSQGKRVLENEPGWDKFKSFDPSKKYCSRTGKIL